MSLRFAARPVAFLSKNLPGNSEKMYAGRRLFSEGVVQLPQYETLALSAPKPFVVQVELNRPNKRNAMNGEMWRDLKLCFDELSYNPDCRAIVLSGAGTVFCAGIDIQAFMSLGNTLTDSVDVARKANIMFKHITAFQDSLTAIEKCLKPVISAVNGACVGSGLDMIAAVDIRYCSKDAWFSAKEVDIGMAPDVGTLQRLPRVIGSQSLVRELIYTARRLDSEEAKECGLVNKLFDTRESCIEGSIAIAAEIASKSPVAVQTAKRNLVFSQDHTVVDGLNHIALLNACNLQSEDLMTGIVGSMSKGEEPPQFAKL